MTFFSRTKQRLWTKGETSGHFLNVVNMTPDCDNDTLLVLANPIGPTCHKGTSSCFGEASHQWLFLYQLEQLLAERKTADPESSYTAKLYASGTKRIAQKVGEEGVETLAATVYDREELTNEASDLMYHLLVLLQDQELDLTAVIENLRNIIKPGFSPVFNLQIRLLVCSCVMRYALIPHRNQSFRPAARQESAQWLFSGYRDERADPVS